MFAGVGSKLLTPALSLYFFFPPSVLALPLIGFPFFYCVFFFNSERYTNCSLLLKQHGMNLHRKHSFFFFFTDAHTCKTILRGDCFPV